MNAPVRTISQTTAFGDIEDFAECCEAHAWYCAEGWISLQTAVDNLQYLAELWNMVSIHGRDEVQAIMASAFALLALEESDVPADYATQIVRQWEMADPRDAWRHTGEAPPPAAVQNSDISEKRTPIATYRTPQSTIDAFWYVASLDNPDHLKRWLVEHPRDVATLQKLWEAKHARP